MRPYTVLNVRLCRIAQHTHRHLMQQHSGVPIPVPLNIPMRMRSWRATWRLRQQRLAPPRRRASHSATCSSVTNCSNAWRLGVGVRRCDRRGGECMKDGRPLSKPRPSRGLPHAHGQAPAAGGQHSHPADDTCRPTTRLQSKIRSLDSRKGVKNDYIAPGSASQRDWLIL